MTEPAKNKAKNLHVNKPTWLKTKIPTGKVYFDIKKDLRSRKLVTVCEEAKCPNIGECWNTRTATFMVLGDTCTRACRFCNVKTGNPGGVTDPQEPLQVAKSCSLMKLQYVVITMVDRDDLSDGGARHVGSVIQTVKDHNPGIKVELLAGDFRGLDKAIAVILESRPEVYAHNLETVERLTPRVRDARASYVQSLQSLAKVKEIASYPVLTKSALMLGLGETREEVIQSMRDLREVGVDLLTVGQYMRPTRKHLAVKEWVAPEVFKELEGVARELGFSGVVCGPLVRSSYRAREFYEDATQAVTKPGAQVE
ncbi:MAG: lipoyl synthase [Oligoflexales bacterium]|nr:lipoyl synthase [Oligoflexales bacterium]